MKFLLFAVVSYAIVASILSIEVEKYGDTKNFKLIDRETAYASADPNGYVTKTFTFPSVS